MPKVTLLREPFQDYTMYLGRKEFRFVGGEGKEVPVAVALECQRRNDIATDPLFQVEDVPCVYQSDDPATVAACKQNVAGAPYQKILVDEKWLSIVKSEDARATAS